MSNNNSAGSRVLLRVFFAVLFAVFGLASCGGGGDSSTVTYTLSYTLSVANSTGGTASSASGEISCGSTCSASFASGTSVTLTASPSTNYSFTGWSGACSGTGTCTVTMSQAVNVTATFTLIPTQQTTNYTLTVTKSGAGTGSVSSIGIACGNTCSASIPSGTPVTLTAAPNTGSTFAGWSGACSGTATTCNVTMSAAESVSATFTLIPTNTIIASAGANGTVTPAGNITVNQGASKAYAITPNSGYTIGTLTVDGISIATSTAYNFTNIQANHTISATFQPAGPIALSLVPARTIGVAPLSVFFDASGTTTTDLQKKPFHDLEYQWDFADVGSGNWGDKSTGSSGTGVNTSRNVAYGPVASHVFETPGNYIVKVTAFDGTNTATTTTTISVDDPNNVFAGTNTICVSGWTSVGVTMSPLPVQGVNGCPAGADTAQQPDFATAISSYALTGKRVLFKRGDTFTAATSARINATGPGIVGAFGTGALPGIQMTGNTSILLISSSTTPGIKDWRVMDLDLNGMSGLATVGIDANGGFNQFLVLRLNIRNIMRGVAAGPDILDWWNNNGHPGHTIWEDWAIVDSTITPISGCGSTVCDWRIYLAGKRAAIQGNFVDNQTAGGSHVVRSEYMGKGVISNNTIARAGVGDHAIKIHANLWTAVGVTGPGIYTEQVVIADNKIIGANNPWTVGLGPRDNTRDERVRDIIVERNWFTAGAGTQVDVLVWTVDTTTIRNNICDMTGATAHQCIAIATRGGEPAPNNVRVYNNTFYSGSAGDFTGVGIDSTATNVTVINNLGSAPSATGPVMISGTGASGFVSSYNLLNNTPSALFVNATPAVPADFSLIALPNPARDTGLGLPTVPVFSDFFQLSRPQNGAIDIGAVEGP
jgi:Divergent InlB B-repeat domain